MAIVMLRYFAAAADAAGREAEELELGAEHTLEAMAPQYPPAEAGLASVVVPA